MLEVVAHVDLLLHNLAAASYAKTLLGARVGLHLRHDLSFIPWSPSRQPLPVRVLLQLSLRPCSLSVQSP